MFTNIENPVLLMSEVKNLAEYPAVVAWFAKAPVSHSVDSDLRRVVDRIRLEAFIWYHNGPTVCAMDCYMYVCMLYISTSVWVLCTPNDGI